MRAPGGDGERPRASVATARQPRRNSAVRTAASRSTPRARARLFGVSNSRPRARRRASRAPADARRAASDSAHCGARPRGALRCRWRRLRGSTTCTPHRARAAAVPRGGGEDDRSSGARGARADRHATECSLDGVRRHGPARGRRRPGGIQGPQRQGSDRGGGEAEGSRRRDSTARAERARPDDGGASRAGTRGRRRGGAGAGERALRRGPLGRGHDRRGRELPHTPCGAADDSRAGRVHALRHVD